MKTLSTLSEDSAFPYKYEGGGEWGLTKREYFAALALQGMLANSKYDPMREPWGLEEKAVECADILIDALNEEKP